MSMGFWGRVRMFPYEIKNKIYNFYLVKKYPWLHPIIVDPNSEEYREIRDPKYDYSYVPIFTNHRGWWKAFGRLFCDEIQKEFKNCPNLYVMDYKEKYGQLDIYMGGANNKIWDICEKYEVISQNVCWFCGVPDCHVTNAGWILPICEPCYIKHTWANKPYKEACCDLDSRIPSSYTTMHYSNGVELKVHHYIGDTATQIRRRYDKYRRPFKRLRHLGC